MKNKSTVTFVTAFIDLNEDSSKRPPETRFKLFKNIADTGVSICLYVSSHYEIIAKEIANKYKNIKLMKITNLEDTETYKIINELNPDLPINRTENHDTLKFMILMNAKSEFVYNASIENPFNTEHFSWIDFSIFHMVNNIEHVKSQIRLFGNSKLKSKMMLFPCCWTLEKTKEYINYISSKVLWRFCGSFFIGDKLSIQEMHYLMLSELPNFIKHTGSNIISWEVNIWAWLEINNNWKIDYYIADHNNTILDMPKKYISVIASLTSIPSRFENCKLVIDSLITQVDYIYLNLCNEYERFKNSNTNTYPIFNINNINEYLPSILLTEEPYKSKLIITFGKDYGPATKYLGALDLISNSQWIFFCDDDQEYNPNLIKKMVNNMDINISQFGIYQNRYNMIKNSNGSGSGGFIHGYVGNLIHSSLLNELPKFDLPDIAKFVDDQWMSIYCHLQNINIYPSGLENYDEIFSILENECEKIGKDSLASLNNRHIKVKELETYYNVKFIDNCNIITEQNKYKTTIVTFYFDIKNLKDSTADVRPPSFYMDKGRETLKLQHPMVIFCGENNYEEIKKIRDEYVSDKNLTNYMIKNITEYDFYKENWNIINENRKDNEFYKKNRVTPSYYLVTSFKVIAIYIAKQNNFYNSKYYAWIDFGGSHIMRDFNNSANKVIENPNPKISLCYIHYRSHNELYPMSKYLINGGYCGIGGTAFTIEDIYVNKFYNGCLSIFHDTLFNGVGHCDEQLLIYFYDRYPELCNIHYGDYYSILQNYHEPIYDINSIINFFINQTINKGRKDLGKICADKLIKSIKKNNLSIENNKLLFLENIIK